MRPTQVDAAHMVREEEKHVADGCEREYGELDHDEGCRDDEPERQEGTQGEADDHGKGQLDCFHQVDRVAPGVGADVLDDALRAGEVQTKE